MSSFIQTTHKNVAEFKNAFENGELDMKPPFQRNPVWTLKQKSYLIDTILNDFPIPEIYMQELVDENGIKKSIVVDGQQRITACLEFLTNQFALDPKDSPAFANLTFDDLTVEQKKKIYSYRFLVRLLPAIGDSELREIFRRLNINNVALNPQELRQATYWGPFIETMNELADLGIWQKLDVFSSNDIKRMLDVEFVSELAIAILHGLQNKKIALDKYYALYETEFAERNKIKETFDLVLRELVNIIPDFGDTRWAKKTDFYSLFLVFANKKHLLPLGTQEREKAREVLMSFAHAVDEFVTIEKQAGDTAHVSQEVTQYALNLRASSDLGARRNREEALNKLLADILK
ncbi:DUF262 domain-containing protein [Fibrisoma montanum]|uniref:DUF262 domain-containing protein n=1 Tax=Fibrisoma montanum TaxID=2305895 RepID=A0A418M6G2_9BACT|nr:DUF262 domain-containing protein [Fibrisoma montanum]RIV21507.1 DUF262 domain-containing protein [Fibrisoma montanum]